MAVILTLLAALIASGACAYHRSSLRTFAVAAPVATLVVGLMAGAPWTTIILLIVELGIAVPLLMDSFRRRQITAWANGIEFYEWRPSDWSEILKVLMR